MSSPRQALKERWLRWRDRWLTSAEFQHWAARFPVTRPVARRRARALFDITAGFVYSQVLFACVELDLFQRLAAGPRPVDDLAREAGIAPERMLRLLQAAASLRLLQSRGVDSFGLGDLGAASLGNPGIAAMVRHHQRLYSDLADPVGLFRGGQPTQLSSFWPYAHGGCGEAAQYSALMASSQAFLVREILATFSLRRYGRLWDIAGGDGAFVSAAVQRWPDLRATVLDLPAVAALARERFQREGVAERADARGGSVFETPLGPELTAADWDGGGSGLPEPAGLKLVTLIRVLHDHDDDRALQLLQTLRASWPSGARLLIAEPMAQTPNAEAMGHAYFGLYLLAMGSGRPRSKSELIAMLEVAGFGRAREFTTSQPLLLRMLVAEAL